MSAVMRATNGQSEQGDINEKKERNQRNVLFYGCLMEAISCVAQTPPPQPHLCTNARRITTTAWAGWKKKDVSTTDHGSAIKKTAGTWPLKVFPSLPLHNLLLTRCHTSAALRSTPPETFRAQQDTEEMKKKKKIQGKRNLYVCSNNTTAATHTEQPE